MEYLYGRPERAVPALGFSFSVLVGLTLQSFWWFAGTALLLAATWNYWSARLVIQDQRLGPVRLATDTGVWLTFDDGPGPDTLEIVETLNRFGYRATFFFIGEQLERYGSIEELSRALREGGHTVANHSYTHPSFLSLSKETALSEIERTQTLLSEIFPEIVLPYFRPPFGYRKRETFQVAATLGLEVVGWGTNSLDFLDGCPNRLARRLQGEISRNSIVLFHDGREKRNVTAGALPKLLEWLKARGYPTYNAQP